METLVERIPTPQTEKKCLILGMIQIYSFFWQCSNYQIPDATIKVKYFSVRSSSTSKQLSLEI